jgi:hypothetical protein
LVDAEAPHGFGQLIVRDCRARVRRRLVIAPRAPRWLKMGRYFRRSDCRWQPPAAHG